MWSSMAEIVLKEAEYSEEASTFIKPFKSMHFLAK
jgi:hypothetical protein